MIREKLSVVLICTNSNESGAPIHVETIVEMLKKSVFFTIVFGENGDVAKRISRGGVEVIIVPELRSQINFYQDLRAYRSIEKVINKVKPDLLHLHSSKSGMLGRLLGVRYKIPIIYTVHGWGWRGFGRVKAIFIWSIEWLLKFSVCSYYIYVSKHVSYEAKNKLGIHPDRGRVIYNGTYDFNDIEKVDCHADNCLKIIMPARVDPAKDHESLVRAFEKLPIQAKLMLCGFGTDSHDFYERVKLWAPTKYCDIVLLGQKSDVPQLLACSDIFVLISHFEALPISIIEAMSIGMPIVATDVGGVSEIVNHQDTGLLVQKGNINNILDVLMDLSDADFRSSLKVASRRFYIENLTASRMAKNTYEYYCDVVNRSSNSKG